MNEKVGIIFTNPKVLQDRISLPAPLRAAACSVLKVVPKLNYACVKFN